MSRKEEASPRRRTTAAALKGATAAFLSEALPPGWVCQPLAPGSEAGKAGDILVISPRGRCHFLFVRAPADRWWDGGGHSVPAERLTARDARMARQLRAAGHRTHAVRGAADLARALQSWGCPLHRPVRLPGLPGAGRPPAAAQAKRPRAVLRLAAWRRPADA